MSEESGVLVGSPTSERLGYEESIRSAMEEMKENSDEYLHFLQALKEGKSWTTIIQEGGHAISEAGKDLEKVVPAVQNVMHAVRVGTSTSEFQMMSGVNRVLTILAVLAPVLEAGYAFLKTINGFDAALNGNSFIASGAMMFFKTFLATRYANLRENIKVAAIENAGKVELVETKG